MTSSSPPRVVVAGGLSAPPAWVIFVVALVLEYLGVSVSVDARDLLVPAGLEPLLGDIGEVAPLVFLFPAAVFLTGGLAVRLRLRALSAYRPERAASLVLGSAHVVLAATFVGLAGWLGEANLDSEATRAWLVLWLGLGVAALSTLALSLWRPTMIIEAFRGLRRELLIGVGVSSFAWGAGLLSRSLWKPLAWLTLEVVHALLTLVTSDPVASIEEALVGTSRFYVRVAPVCSGMEGIALMLTFVGAYLFIQRRELHWPRSFALLPLSAMLVWALNAVRVTALILVGTWYSPEVALGGFHSKAGWVFFALAALGIIYAVQRSPRFHTQTSTAPVSTVPLGAVDTAPSDHGALTAAYLAPLLLVLASKLVTGLAASGIDYFYGVSIVAGAFGLWKFRHLYPRASFGSAWLPVAAGCAVACFWILGFAEPSGSAPTLGDELDSLSRPLAGTWLALRAVGTIVTVPVVEELAFRGYLFRRFRGPSFQKIPYRDFSWLGLIVSSTAFGLLHSQWILGIGAGFVFGLLTVVRNRLSDAIVAHATANAVIFIYALMTGTFALIA